jgi:hypothetical protein
MKTLVLYQLSTGNKKPKVLFDLCGFHTKQEFVTTMQLLLEEKKIQRMITTPGYPGIWHTISELPPSITDCMIVSNLNVEYAIC